MNAVFPKIPTKLTSEQTVPIVLVVPDDLVVAYAPKPKAKKENNNPIKKT
jgi:hypothetical protein